MVKLDSPPLALNAEPPLTSSAPWCPGPGGTELPGPLKGPELGWFPLLGLGGGTAIGHLSVPGETPGHAWGSAASLKHHHAL